MRAYRAINFILNRVINRAKVISLVIFLAFALFTMYLRGSSIALIHEGIKSTTISHHLSTQELLVEKGITPLYHENLTDVWVRNLYNRLDRIRLKCGDLCSMNDLSTLEKYRTSQGNDFHIQVPNVDCRAILDMDEIDEGDLTFPEYPPDGLLPFYTLHQSIPVNFVRVERNGYLGAVEPLVWSKTFIDSLVHQATQGTLEGTYGHAVTNYLRQELSSIQDKLVNRTVLVIGSEHPWVEALLLSLGVSHVKTLEYRPIISEHERISTETPSSIREKTSNGTFLAMDGVVSFSSLEHSGLGRYGDALNPWGDILAVARAWCLTKRDGFLVLGLPTTDGEDSISWNLHRVYGKLRWPLVTANWIFIDRGNAPWIKNHGMGDVANIFVKREF